MNIYNKNLYNNLKVKFNGADKINQNYSQSYQDLFILSILNGNSNGFFLEIGAMHPEIISNTFLLESQYNWSGISIEIQKINKFGNIEEMFKKTRKNTEIIIQDALEINYEKMLIEKNAPPVIDYLQLDIEPAQNTLSCLYKIPFNKYKFKVITFETEAYYTQETVNESRKFLIDLGYELVAKNVCNQGNDPYEDWYVNPKFIDEKTISIFKTNNEINPPFDLIFNS